MAEKSASKVTTKSKKSVKKAVKKKAAAKKTTAAESSKAKTAKKAAKKSGSKTAAAKKSGNGTGIKKAKATAGDGKRFTLIQQEAYYIAEKRGFVGGDPEQDWLMAEKQVDKMLKQSST